MTRVAVQVDQLWFAQPGGIGSYIRGLVPALAAADPTLDITAFHARSDRTIDEPWLREVAVVELRGGIRTLYPAWDLLDRPRLPRMLAAADVLHATGVAGIPPTPRNAALAVTVHDVAFRTHPRFFPPRWRVLHEIGLRRAASRWHAILVPSRAAADDLARAVDVDPARVHVTPLASSLPIGQGETVGVRRRLGIPDRYVLFVGTMEPRKGLVTLIRAYRAIAPRIPHALVLAGPRGWRDGAIARELDASGPGEIVSTGAVSRADLDALYRGAAAFCYPSTTEGFGLPVLEAMERGIPTVVSDAPALVEVAGDAAVSSPVGDDTALARTLLDVLEDPEDAARLAVAGRERAAMFTWGATAEATIVAYAAARRVVAP